MNILIAEDNPAIQMLHSELMNHWGHDFDMASDGTEAVALARKNSGKYDVCLMDVEMPGMNGIEATRVIRNTVAYVPILALTANSAYRKACLEVGMDDFAEKPCLPGELIARINELAVKSYQLSAKQHGLCLTEVMPVDQQHAQELRKLKKQGLIKMRLDGPDDREVIAHRNVPNKISHDFVVMKYSMTEFLNRDPDRPTVCDLYRGSKNCIIETFVGEEEYKDVLDAENERMDSYQTKYFKPDEE